MPISGQKKSAPTSTRCTCIISCTYVDSSEARYQPEKYSAHGETTYSVKVSGGNDSTRAKRECTRASRIRPRSGRQRPQRQRHRRPQGQRQRHQHHQDHVLDHVHAQQRRVVRRQPGRGRDVERAQAEPHEGQRPTDRPGHPAPVQRPARRAGRGPPPRPCDQGQRIEGPLGEEASRGQPRQHVGGRRSQQGQGFGHASELYGPTSPRGRGALRPSPRHNGRVATTATIPASRLHGHHDRPSMVAVGTIIWLSSELMFFAALFASYFTIRSVSPRAVGPEHRAPQRALRLAQHHDPGAVVADVPARRVRGRARPGRAHGLGARLPRAGGCASGSSSPTSWAPSSSAARRSSTPR